MSEESLTASLVPIKFPPEILARIAPEFSLQKHLQIGLRPSLRKFEEFKTVDISEAGIGRYEASTSGQSTNNTGSILGSSILKSGSTTVICTISAGIIEDSQELVNDYRMKLDKDIITNPEEAAHDKSRNSSVYTEVEISRGRAGPPTEEEIVLSQKLYETLYHSGLLKKESLAINLGLKYTDENGKVQIVYKREDSDDDVDLWVTKPKGYSFVLYSNIQVFSRTGPLFDLCYGALLAALKRTKLPSNYIDERNFDFAAGVGKSRGNVGNDYSLVCDPTSNTPLKLELNNLSWSSTFGLVEVSEDTPNDVDKMDLDSRQSKRVLLADLEGDAEEAVATKLDIVSNQDGLTSLTLFGGDSAGISRSDIEKAIDLSRRRARNMIQSL